jgi:hypothetical protein
MNELLLSSRADPPRLLRDSGRRGNSAPENQETLTLERPTEHSGHGRGPAFVRSQRYTSEPALLREPRTSAKLLDYEKLLISSCRESELLPTPAPAPTRSVVLLW